MQRRKESLYRLYGNEPFCRTNRALSDSDADTFECIDGKRIDESSLYDPTDPKKNRDRGFIPLFSSGITITVNTVNSSKLKVILNVVTKNRMTRRTEDFEL